MRANHRSGLKNPPVPPARERIVQGIASAQLLSLCVFECGSFSAWVVPLRCLYVIFSTLKSALGRHILKDLRVLLKNWADGIGSRVGLDAISVGWLEVWARAKTARAGPQMCKNQHGPKKEPGFSRFRCAQRNHFMLVGPKRKAVFRSRCRSFERPLSLSSTTLKLSPTRRPRDALTWNIRTRHRQKSLISALSTPS